MDGFKITLYRGSRQPANQDVNKELQWFCTSLGLVGNRDKNLSTFRIFIVLLKARQKGHMLSSDDIASETDLSRATVIHHISKLSGSSLIEEEHDRYRLSVDSMEALVRHVNTEIERSMHDLEEMGKRIDRDLGLR